MASSSPILGGIEENEGIIYAFIVTMGWFFLLMLLMSSFALLHLGYYILSSYIGVITLDLKSPSQIRPSFESISKPLKIHKKNW